MHAPLQNVYTVSSLYIHELGQWETKQLREKEETQYLIIQPYVVTPFILFKARGSLLIYRL